LGWNYRKWGVTFTLTSGGVQTNKGKDINVDRGMGWEEDTATLRTEAAGEEHKQATSG
jgi:hypothetical protein